MAATITIDKQIIRAGETATITISFPENEVFSYTEQRFHQMTITGGSTPNGFSVVQGGGDRIGYRVITTTFMPSTDLEQSDCRIIWNSSNDNNDGQSATFSVDTRRPTVASASIAQSDLRPGEKPTIPIPFSELVLRDPFPLDDLRVGAGKGTLSNLRAAPNVAATPTAAITWLVDLEAPATPPATGLDDNQIQIDLLGITDRVGNTGPRGRWNWETLTSDL